MLPYNKDLKAVAQRLRREMTDMERRLWRELRGKQVERVQFYRQKTLGNYIVDFYAPDVGLVIEIDGDQHADEDHREKDRKRDAWLSCQGIQVLRVTNQDVIGELEGVMETIQKAIEGRRRS